MELYQLKEGDWLYHSGCVKEELITSFNESEDADYNETDDSNNVNSSPSYLSLEDENNFQEATQTFNDENNENTDGVFVRSLNNNISLGKKLVESTDANNTSHNQNVTESLILSETTDQNDFGIPNKQTRFSSKNQIDRYCFNCHKSVNDRWGKKKLANCRKCKTPFKYRCINCNQGFEKRIATFLHVKYKCESKHMIQCSKCYYATTKKENLAEHKHTKHAILECSKCNMKCESCQITKHQLYECKLQASLNEDTTSKVTFVNIKGFRKQHSRWNFNYFLELYCKSCDKVVTSVENNKNVKKCGTCKTMLQYQCAICCKYFSRQVNVYSHIRICSKPPEYFCAQCDFNTCYKTRLMDHMHDTHLPKECQICGMMCENGRNLTDHEKRDCKNNPRFTGEKSKNTKICKWSMIKFFCPQCNVVTERNTSKCTPCSTCGTIQKFHCSVCKSSIFKNFLRAQKHLKLNLCAQLYQCYSCRFRATSQEKLLEHKIQEHSKVLVECPNCSDSVKEDAYEKHKEICSRPPKYSCTLCSCMFPIRNMLKKHVIREHGDTKEKYYCLCVACGRKMTTKNLNRHLKRNCLPRNDNEKSEEANCFDQSVTIVDIEHHNTIIVYSDVDDDDIICLDD